MLWAIALFGATRASLPLARRSGPLVEDETLIDLGDVDIDIDIDIDIEANVDVDVDVADTLAVIVDAASESIRLDVVDTEEPS